MERKRRYRRVRQIAKIREAQGGLCAACGLPVPPPAEQSRQDENAPTFDHIVPRCRGGTNGDHNGIMKHRRCNRKRGDQLPTGCDFVWQLVVWAKVVIPAAEADDQLARIIGGGLPLGTPVGETLRSLLPSPPTIDN